MFSEIGIGFNDSDSIKNLRDEIIHSGISQYDFTYNYNIFKIVQNLIRSYLAKLIGYNKDIRKYK